MSQHEPIFGYKPVSRRGVSSAATMFNRFDKWDQFASARSAHIFYWVSVIICIESSAATMFNTLDKCDQFASARYEEVSTYNFLGVDMFQ